MNKILIVDDMPNNLFSFKAILQSSEIDILTASSGEECLKLLLDHPDVMLILMDVQMPGMDGFETAELIHGQPRFYDLPILFITAVYLDNEFARRGFKVGGTDYITKPVDSAILTSKVNVFLTIQNQKLQMARMLDELTQVNSELEQLAYAASHDLQEPLNTMSNYVRLLQKRYSRQLDETGLAYLDFIVDAATRMKELVRALLDYSRLRRQDLVEETIYFNQVIQEIQADLEDIIQRTNTKITFQPDVQLCGNSALFKELMYNLVINAIKYRQPNITPQIHISVEDNDTEWLIGVKDNGIGIDAKYHDKIFEIFRRLHTRDEVDGLGLGLALCKKIVDLHHGKIWLESTVGVGTTFYFTIRKKVSEF